MVGQFYQNLRPLVHKLDAKELRHKFSHTYDVEDCPVLEVLPLLSFRSQAPTFQTIDSIMSCSLAPRVSIARFLCMRRRYLWG